MDDESLLMIEDGDVDDVGDEPASFPEPANEGISADAWHEEGEEEAGMVDDPPLEPSGTDPYQLKAESVSKLRSPRLDEKEDSQVMKASSAESLPETPPRKEVPALTRRPHVITPKKLFQEEPAPPADLSAARELMRQQLRQIL